MNSTAQAMTSDIASELGDSHSRYRGQDSGNDAAMDDIPRKTPEALDAHLPGIGEEDLAPWVALPGGGLEWRPW